MDGIGEELRMHWMTLEDVYNKTVSYAQNYEDILLGRVFREPEGFYLDVGANHPVFHSVTKMFSDRGWRGINIEPSPVVWRHLVEDRPRDINLNLGLADSDGTLTFYESTNFHGWSTFRVELAEHYRAHGEPMVERPVPVTTLAKVCDEYVNRTIDFLKIDAEGFERQVLLGADFSRWRPRVLLIENSWPDAWAPLLDGIDYLPAGFDGLNRYYVRAEDEPLLPAFATTANALDNFVPYEYIRLFDEIAKKVEGADPAVFQGPRHDGPRVLRRLRSAVRGLVSRGARRAAG